MNIKECMVWLWLEVWLPVLEIVPEKLPSIIIVDSAAL